MQEDARLCGFHLKASNHPRQVLCLGGSRVSKQRAGKNVCQFRMVLLKFKVTTLEFRAKTDALVMDMRGMRVNHFLGTVANVHRNRHTMLHENLQSNHIWQCMMQ